MKKKSIILLSIFGSIASIIGLILFFMNDDKPVKPINIHNSNIDRVIQTETYIENHKTTKDKKIELFYEIDLRNKKTYIFSVLNLKPKTEIRGNDLWEYDRILILCENPNKQITFYFEPEISKSTNFPVTPFNRDFESNVIFGRSKFSDLPNLNNYVRTIKGHSSAGGMYAAVTYYSSSFGKYYTFGTTNPSEIYGELAVGDFFPDKSYLKDIKNDLINFIIISDSKKFDDSLIFACKNFIDGGTG